MSRKRSFGLDTQQHYTVEFYTKPGCCLCDDVRDILEDIAAAVPYDLAEHDIRADRDLFERYRYRIPVIIINKTTTLEGRIDERALRRALSQMPTRA
jgi:glutaredoxin